MVQPQRTTPGPTQTQGIAGQRQGQSWSWQGHRWMETMEY